MTTNRKLKTDGNLEIESAQVDINSDIDVAGDVGSTTVTTSSNATIGGDIDVTGDVGGATATITGNATVGGDIDVTGDLGGATATVTGNATVGGTLGVTGQATLSGLAFPTNDGTNGQALITNGSGTLSFGDVASGGGVDTITSATEAASYSGTNRIIHITATENVTFTSALSDRIIINETTYQTKFEANLTNCKINTIGDVYIYNTSTNGSTDIDIEFCNIFCNTLVVDNSGNTSGNQTNLKNSRIFAGNITLVTRATSSGYFFMDCDIYGTGTLTMPPSGGGNLNIWFSNVNVNQISGYTNLNSSFPSVVNVRQGSSGATQIQIGSTDYLNQASGYSYPFKVDNAGINTNVIVKAYESTGYNAGQTQDITYDTTEIDNTSCFSSSTFTAKVKGYYKIDSFLGLGNHSATNSFQHFIKLNGSTITATQTSGCLSSDGSFSKQGILSNFLNLNVGDTVSIYVYSVDTAWLVDDARTFLLIQKIN